MSELETEHDVDEVQLNVGKVPEDLKRKIDVLVNKLNAAILESGGRSISKKDWFAVAIYKYLTDSLGWAETKEKAMRKVLAENFAEEFQKILEEAYNV